MLEQTLPYAHTLYETARNMEHSTIIKVQHKSGPEEPMPRMVKIMVVTRSDLCAPSL